MRVCIFASGSGGNCLLVSGEGGNILIDAGISMRRIVNGLAQAGLSLQNINGVLITHEHSDHISGLKMLMKHTRLPIFAPDRLARELVRLIPESEDCMNTIPLTENIQLAGFGVSACRTPHDAVESVAYKVHGERTFALATDMGHVTEDVQRLLSNVDAAVIESNYDEEMLRYGPYPVFLKRRILSQNGHLSNDSCAELASQLVNQGTKQIVLGHLSKENNRPEIALETVRPSLQDSGCRLLCAPPQGFLEINL